MDNFTEKKFEHPCFFLLGAPRSGTSSLIGELTKHPKISTLVGSDLDRGEATETGHPLISPYARGALQIDEQMDSINHRVSERGFCSLLALRYGIYMPHIMLNIKRRVVKPKIIIVLRNPTDRAYSSHTHKKPPTSTFREKIDIELSTLSDFNSFAKRNSFIDVSYLGNNSLIERGLYHHHLLNLFNIFSRDQVLVFSFEDCRSNMKEVVDKTINFLELESYDGLHEEVHRGQSENRESIDLETRTLLDDFYRPHNLKLFDLLGWKENTWTR